MEINERKRKMSDQFIPIKLPSKCLAYKSVDPTKIKIRTFKGRDQELISELTLGNVRRQFIILISNVLEGIKADELTSGDAKYIMLWEAINSYSPTYPVKVVCDGCEHEIRIEANLKEVESVELPDDFKQPMLVTLSDGKVLSLRMLTLADEVSALDFASKGKSPYLYTYAMTIIDDKLDILAKMRMLEELSVKDLNIIEKWHIDNEHGPDMVVSYKCPMCNYEGKLELPFRFDKLFSFRR